MSKHRQKAQQHSFQLFSIFLLDFIWLFGKITKYYDKEKTMNANCEEYRNKAQIMKALAHPTRLFLVHELSRGERCVCKLTEMIGNDVSTVSKHLGVLKGAGIVSDEKRGNQVFYSLQYPCVLNLFSCIESVLQQSRSSV